MEPDTPPSTSRPDYSANVRAEIARARRTQRDVAERTGIPWSTWARRMDATTAWSAAELQRVADVLGVPVDRLWAAAG